MKDRQTIFIYGRHSLEEALAGRPEAVKRVFLADKHRSGPLAQTLNRLAVPTAELKTESLNQTNQEQHQGIIAKIDLTQLLWSLKEFLSTKEVNTETALILLEEIQDPQNVGAIIRSAAAFGLAGVLIPTRRQAPITGAVARASAGMIFRLPIISIGNVNQTLTVLQKSGFWSHALTNQADRPLEQESFDQPTVFILGNEATGLRSQTLKLADTANYIPIHPRTESLNVSAAAAVAAYAWSRQHWPALQSTNR